MSEISIRETALERNVIERIKNDMEYGYIQKRPNESSSWGDKIPYMRNTKTLWFTETPLNILKSCGIETTQRRAEDLSNLFDGTLSGFYYVAMSSFNKTDESAKMILGYISETFKNRKIDIRSINTHIPASWLCYLIECLETGKVPKKHQKDFIDELIDADKFAYLDVKNLIEDLLKNPKYEVLDNSFLTKLIEDVFLSNEKAVEDAKTNPKKIGFLIGQVMKLSEGKASPQDVSAMINEKLKS
jgi:Asp-tRNA(Asn)/Glu-tRNA(Gln) amidotransferase B subunit